MTFIRNEGQQVLAWFTECYERELIAGMSQVGQGSKGGCAIKGNRHSGSPFDGNGQWSAWLQWLLPRARVKWTREAKSAQALGYPQRLFSQSNPVKAGASSCSGTGYLCGRASRDGTRDPTMGIEWEWTEACSATASAPSWRLPGPAELQKGFPSWRQRGEGMMWIQAKTGCGVGSRLGCICLGWHVLDEERAGPAVLCPGCYHITPY